MVEAKVDTSEWQGMFDKLGTLGTKLARSMGVAGGEVIRDEAKLRVNEGPTGNLKAALYLAYRDDVSNETHIQYSVSWNKAKAPHGHLIEMGHWQPYVQVQINGEWVTTNQLRPHPKWIPAQPFLRPAYSAAKSRAVQAMLARGRVRYAELLRGESNDA